MCFRILCVSFVRCFFLLSPFYKYSLLYVFYSIHFSFPCFMLALGSFSFFFYFVSHIHTLFICYHILLTVNYCCCCCCFKCWWLSHVFGYLASSQMCRMDTWLKQIRIKNDTLEKNKIKDIITLIYFLLWNCIKRDPKKTNQWQQQ